jgi:hypothetical protein
MLRWPMALTVFLLLLAVPASAGAVHFPNSGGCTDPGQAHGYCSALRLLNIRSGPFFELKSYEGPGRAELCLRAVRVPETCVSRRLHYEAETHAWVARVLSGRVPIKQSGCFTARWLDPKTGHRLGPKLGITILLHEHDQVPCLRETGETSQWWTPIGHHSKTVQPSGKG